MTLIFDNEYDLTADLLNSGEKVSGDITDVMGLIAKEKTYVLKDYNSYYDPDASIGFFNVNPWRGRRIEETNDLGVIVFSGSVQKLKVTAKNELVITAQEDMTIFLDFVVDTSDRTTHSGFLTNGFTAQGAQSIQIDTGTTDIPVNSRISFNDSKNPSYVITESSGSPTTTVTLDRKLELNLDDNSTVTIAVPITTTGSLALKNALQTSNPSIRIDGTFDLLDIQDTANGYTIDIDVQDQDGITLREHIRQISSMTNLYLLQKEDGGYTVRRGLNYDPNDPIDELTGSEISQPLETPNDDSRLYIGYQCFFKSGTNQVGLVKGDVDQSYINKFKGIHYWNPIPESSTFHDYHYLYTSEISATYFGELILAYYREVKKLMVSTCKMSYNIDVNHEINITLGKQFNVTVKNFIGVKMIVVGFEYDQMKQQYTRLVLQRND